MFLLQKVKSSQTLTKSEIEELRRYERLSAKTKSQVPEITSKKQTKPKKRKTKKKNIKKKTDRKRRSRSPVTEAEIRLMGLECDNLTEADATLKKAKSLSEIFLDHPKIKQAWERGRLLRKLRDLARTGASISAAAKRLNFSSGQQLKDLINEDEEIGDLWDQTTLELHFEIKTAIIEAAKEGNLTALKAVDGFLVPEKEITGLDASRITIKQLSELTGKNRKTIHEWFSKCGLPRNPDKTFDLSIFFGWFEDYLLKRATSSPGKISTAPFDPLRSMRAEKLQVELAKHRNQLLDREEVIMGQIAWVQNIITFCDRGTEELAKLCSSQPREKIIEITKRFFRDLHSEAAKIPGELNLPGPKEKQLIELLLSLRPRGERNDT